MYSSQLEMDDIKWSDDKVTFKTLFHVTFILVTFWNIYQTELEIIKKKKKNFLN